MNDTYFISKTTDQKIDQLEASMVANGNLVTCPLVHRFTPGLYIREIFMPAGSIVTSRVHKTEHQFFILEGAVSVFSDNDGEQQLEAPYVGKTLSGTRRVLYIHKNCRWITCHATDIKPKDDSPEAYKEAVEAVEAQIIQPYVNEVIGVELKNNVLIKPLNQ